MRPATDERCSTSLLHGKRTNIHETFSTPVITILLMAICTMLVISCVEWTLLLFLNHGTSLSNTHDVYFSATAFALLAPVFANPILGIVSARYGSGPTLCFSYLVGALGILMISLFRQSTFLFYVGYEVYALCTTLRIVRLSIIAEVVPTSSRTTVMGVHQLMAPIGALLGPLLWLLIQTWRGQFAIANWLVIDRFLINYLASVGLLVGMFVIGMATLRSLPTAVNDTSQENANVGGRYNSIAGGKSVKVDVNAANEDMSSIADVSGLEWSRFSRFGRFTYYCALTLLMESTMALVRVSFQPVLIGVYGADDEEVGKVYSIIAGLAFVPSVAVALLSRVVKDRDIMLMGMTLKLSGSLMCLPFFGRVRKWQLVTGYMLCSKASNFFLTAAFSAFSKSAGGKNQGKQMGYLWSVCQVGPAVIQFFFASSLVDLFGSWGFGICALPVLAGFVLVFHPWGWRLLGAH